MAPLAAGILLAAAAAHADAPRELTDQDVVDYVMHSGSPQPQRQGDVLGLLHGATVRLDRGSSDVGPGWEILWLDPPAGQTCADVGGVMRSRLVSTGWFHRSKMYCTPKAVADAEDRELQAAQRRATGFPHLGKPQASQPPADSSPAPRVPPSDAWFLGIVPTDQTRAYVEESSIDELPDHTRIAWVTNVTPGEAADHHGFVMLRSQVRFDCAKHAYEYLEGATYDLHGAVMKTAKPATVGWDPTSSEGGTAVAEAFVCGDGAYRATHFRRVQPGDALLGPPSSKDAHAPPTP